MSEKEVSKVIYSLDELRLAINKIFDDRLFRGELSREVNLEFKRKGLSDRNLQMLLNEQIDIINLTDEELIAFAKVSFDKLKWDALKPSRYFSDIALAQYESKIVTEKADDKIIELKNFIKIDDVNYRGQISYEDLYKYMSNNSIFYDYQAQRSSSYRTLGGKKKKVRTPNLNKKAVKEISQSILDGSFEDSEIVLNCEMIRGKSQKFHYEAKLKDNNRDILGDIIIEPNYDINDSDTTWVSVTDGFHRIQGIIIAYTTHYQKTGQPLEGSIGVRLVRADKERAKRIVHQTFKRSADKPEWVNALVSNDYSKFVDSVLKYSKRLTAENTMEDAKINNKLTSKALLIDVTKEMNIAFNDVAEREFKSGDIAEKFDLIYDFAKKMNIEITRYKALGYYYLAYLLTIVDMRAIEAMKLLENSKEYQEFPERVDELNKYIKVISEVIANE